MLVCWIKIDINNQRYNRHFDLSGEIFVLCKKISLPNVRDCPSSDSYRIEMTTCN
jgi:hypothetical protein